MDVVTYSSNRPRSLRPAVSFQLDDGSRPVVMEAPTGDHFVQPHRYGHINLPHRKGLQGVQGMQGQIRDWSQTGRCWCRSCSPEMVFHVSELC